MAEGFTFNKALGAGVSGVLVGALGPMLLGLLHMIQPVAAAFNPALGVLVGLVVSAVTWFTKKNAAPKAKPLTS